MSPPVLADRYRIHPHAPFDGMGNFPAGLSGDDPQPTTDFGGLASWQPFDATGFVLAAAPAGPQMSGSYAAPAATDMALGDAVPASADSLSTTWSAANGPTSMRRSAASIRWVASVPAIPSR